jgi:hypothetical protein
LAAGIKADGKDNTSVGASLPRNRRFKERIAALVVNRRLTVPLRPTARLARSRNPRSAASLNLATRL